MTPFIPLSLLLEEESLFKHEYEYLQFYKERKSWIDALEHCQREASDLAQITDPKVQNIVNSTLKKNEVLPDGVWIGLERSIFGFNVSWQWTSGTHVKHNRWHSTFPVDSLNNHCGKIILANSDFMWLDANCHDKLPFICQGKLLFDLKADLG
ncbi:regenerating islet-derived protein 3-gamma-like [Toxotes jaculatrix]|uniref:regenerating islet-derived protein 3-gamma-like n=1 Tax=Toxotes jaculatrix TaxID=941984 RepID=UPI001B3B10CA|nr:regenerating islet-derived protein 3-gamma-like [Toxotes jaculatrix]